MSAFGERLWDDDLIGAPDSPRPAPQITSSLLNQLSIARSPRRDQEQAILGWLSQHEPSRYLRESLIEDGYGHLLRQHQTA